MTPRFSIITVTRNNREGLRRTLESIRSQTYGSREVIVIDGNSTDGSDQVIDQFSNVISVAQKDHGQGIYPAMNQGVSLAKGEWVIFMNSGDFFLEPTVLERFSAPEEAQIVFGKARKPDGSPHLDFLGWERIHERMPFCHQATFCKTELLKSRPLDPRFNIVADYEFIMWAHATKRSFHEISLEIAEIEPGGVSESDLVRRVWQSYRAAIRHFPVVKVHRFYLRKLKWALGIQVSRSSENGRLKRLRPLWSLLRGKASHAPGR